MDSMNYREIEIYLERARRLRSEATGELIAAGWHGAQRLVFSLLKRVQQAFQRVSAAHP